MALQVRHIPVGHLRAVAASAVPHAAVSVSVDGGKTWHRARVTGHDGRYTAVFSAPAGAKVSLRTTAGDAAGGSVTETITSGRNPCWPMGPAACATANRAPAGPPGPPGMAGGC